MRINKPGPYVDTDVLIWFLTGDDLKKQKAAAVIFEKVSKRELVLCTPDTVIADTVYVLSSPRLYHLTRPQIRDILTPLVGLSGFKVENKRSVLEPLVLYSATSLDFGDAFLVSRVRQATKKIVYSYDHDFDNLNDVIRIEP